MTESGHYFVGKVPFRIGVSYSPRHSAPDFWRHFDLDEIHEDFSILSEFGVNLARVALHWDYFQPSRESLSCSALAHLLGLCDAAASEGVRLELLMFAGEAGQHNRLPQWLQEEALHSAETCGGSSSGCPEASLFTSSAARTAAVQLVRGVARTVGTHPAIWAYNLGDRPDRLASPPCRTAVSAWFQELRTVVHSIDAKHPVTCSLGGPNLSTNVGLRVDQVFSVLDHSTIDSEGLASALGPGDMESQVVFGCALTSALTGKPCLAQESWRGKDGADRQQRPSARALLLGLHRVGALGAIIGSCAEPARESNWPGGFGLFDDDGHPSDHAEGIREFTRAKPLVQIPAAGPLALGLTADEYYEAPTANIRKLYQEFHSRSPVPERS